MHKYYADTYLSVLDLKSWFQIIQKYKNRILPIFSVLQQSRKNIIILQQFPSWNFKKKCFHDMFVLKHDKFDCLGNLT